MSFDIRTWSQDRHDVFGIRVSDRVCLTFEEWMKLDLQYIDTWSPLLDLTILFKTVPAVFTGRGAA